MKKFYLIVTAIFALLSFNAKAQTAAGPVNATWSFPVIYNYDEEVTWYFDLSTTTFPMGSDVYIWIWSPSEPDAGNWENSSDFAKLTYVEGMTWKFTLTPTVYFSMTADAIAASAGFWYRLKDDAGTMQSDVASIAYTPFSSFYTANEMIRAYPTAPSLDKGLSILFNSNLAPGFEGATSVHMHSGLNNWDLQVQYQSWIPEVVLKTQLKNLGNGFYKMDLVPKEYFNAPDGYIMNNMNYLFVKDDWAATTPDQVLNAAEYIPPPPPEFRFFPSQISKKDFLGVIRKNNEPGIIKLIYTVTANGTTVSNGEFTGNMSEIKGFINLPQALRTVNATDVHVLVKDNSDRTISDTTIPLKTLD